MVVQNGLMRIFWPAEPLKSVEQGVIVGWRNSELDVFVAAILHEAEVGCSALTKLTSADVLTKQLKSVENALRTGILFRNSPHPTTTLLERCGPSPLQVLGVLNQKGRPISLTAAHIIAKTIPSSDIPEIQSAVGCDITFQLIVFQRPHPTRMQYMSLDPISLALDDKAVSLGTEIPPLDKVDAAENEEHRRQAALVEKLKLHSVINYPRSEKEISLPTILNQINCSFEINRLVQRNIGLVRLRQKRSLSVTERVAASASNLWDHAVIGARYAFSEYLLPILTKVFILTLTAIRMVTEVIVIILHWQLRPQGASLKDVSATAQQIDLRLQQFCYWPIQYLTLRDRKDDWESTTDSHPEYIRFYNSLWLVANDIIIGVALGSYLIENADYVSAQADRVLGIWSLEGLRRIIAWLMVYPAGLKLNTELAKFLGDLFLWVIDYWAGCMGTFRPYLPHLFRFIGIASFAGASMPLSLLTDLLSLLTLHIYCFYAASARIYGWQLTIIISLFHLFRGKKRNILRNRIDSCDYELDQLLLGTILFTLLFFLLPTVVVFYITFAFARMGIICLKALLDTMLACLNHFPLFALMLRIKDSKRLPGGIRFELGRIRSQDLPASTSIIYLKPIPLPLSAMFHEYSQLGNRIRKHYLSPGVFLCLATGGFVPPIHRKNLYGLQYSMLPAKRVGISELWKRLNGSAPITNLSSKKQALNGHVQRLHH